MCVRFGVRVRVRLCVCWGIGVGGGIETIVELNGTITHLRIPLFRGFLMSPRFGVAVTVTLTDVE